MKKKLGKQTEERGKADNAYKKNDAYKSASFWITPGHWKKTASENLRLYVCICVVWDEEKAKTLAGNA